jgi:hypothetical protein
MLVSEGTRGRVPLLSCGGCKSCAACPHLAAGKSPLHLSKRATPPARTDSPNQQEHRNPVVRLMEMCKRDAALQTVLETMNESYAVVRYGSEIAIAIIKRDKIETTEGLVQEHDATHRKVCVEVPGELLAVGDVGEVVAEEASECAPDDTLASAR